MLPKPEKLKNILGEVVAAAGIGQFRCAETEKNPHVTFFFNNYRKDPFPGEERACPASPKAFRTLAAHVAAGGEVCFPNNGVDSPAIGGGLRQTAPAIDHFITKCYRHLMSLDIRARRDAGEKIDVPGAGRAPGVASPPPKSDTPATS